MGDRAAIDIARSLAPARRSIIVRRIQSSVLTGLGVGCLLAAATVLISRIWPHHLGLPVALLILGVVILASTLIALVRRPSRLQAARTADAHFSLQDRITTAMEFSGSADSLPTLQRRDTARRLRGLPLQRSGGKLEWRRGVLGAAGIAALALVNLVPSTSTAGASSRANRTEMRHIHQVAKVQIPKIMQQATAKLNPTERRDEAVFKLHSALSRLRSQLLKSASKEQALLSVSKTQEQLQRLASRLHRVSQKALSQLNQSLGHRLSSANGSRQSAVPRRQSYRQTSRAIERLSRAADLMTGSERLGLSSSLAKAARQNSDPQLRHSLRRAASALANGNTVSASRSLQQAAARLARTGTRRMPQGAPLTQANQELDSLKSSLSGVGSKQSRLSQGRWAVVQPGSASQGRANQKSSANGSSQTQINAPQRPGSGAQSSASQNAQDPLGGSVFAAPQGQHQLSSKQAVIERSQSSGTGSGPGTRGPNRAGRYATVYIPGAVGTGRRSVMKAGSGDPLQSPVVPYRRVIAKYREAARTALEGAPIPPSLVTYVRNYFTAISR